MPVHVLHGLTLVLLEVKEVLNIEVPMISCVVQSTKSHTLEDRPGKTHRRRLQSAGDVGSLDESLGSKLSKKQIECLEKVLQEKGLKAIRVCSLKKLK